MVKKRKAKELKVRKQPKFFGLLGGTHVESNKYKRSKIKHETKEIVKNET